MLRYLMSIMLALALIPAGAQGATSTLRWMAGANGTVTSEDGTVKLVGPTAPTDAYVETLSDGGFTTSKTFTATANPGYHFRNYSGTNGFVKRTDAVIAVNLDGKDHDIIANFTTAIDQFDLLVHGVPEVADIQAGRTHTVVLKKDGTVVAWGGQDGQDGQSTDPKIPALSTLTGLTAIAAGQYSTFVVTPSAVLGYGVFEFSNVSGVQHTAVFVPDPPPTNVIALAAGLAHVVALKSDGTVVVWGGDNGSQQLNIPSDLYVSKLSGKAVKVTAIAAGNNFTLALMNDGTVRGWGQDDEGEITGIPAPASGKIVAVSAKAWHAMVLYDNGTVKCWGQDDFNQSEMPAGLSNVKAIAAGGHHSVALKKDGTVVVWGGNKTNSGVPQGFVPTGTGGTTMIAAGYYHTIALTPAAILGWGANEAKQCEAPVRAYSDIKNGSAVCQTVHPYSPSVEYGSDSTCTITPTAGMKSYIAVNGIQQSVADGSTTMTIKNIQGFNTVTAAFGVAPDAPGIASVTATDNGYKVAITAPANNGGSPVTGYSVTTKTPSAGLGTDSDLWSANLVHTVTNLSNGTNYTFTATARNLLGTGPASAPSKLPQAITVTTPAPSSASFGSSFTVAATAPGGAVSYSSGGGCDNNGAIFTMNSPTLTCTVKYDQAGNASYAAAPQVTSDTAASKANQSITVTTGKAAPASAQYGASFTVDATAPGGAISYSSAGGCSNVGPVFTMTSASTACVVKYDQAGDINYNAAAQVTSQTLAAKADQAIVITAGKAAPASAPFGSSFTVAATALGGDVTYGSSGGCSNVGPLFTMTSASIPCTVSYTQGGSANFNAAPALTSQTLASAAAQVITITAGKSAPASAQFGSSFTVEASAQGGPVSFSSQGGCSNVGSVFTMTSGSDPCTVKYDQAGGNGYAAAAELVSQTTATKADQSITVTAGKGAPTAATFGTSFTVDATAPGGAVSYGSAGGCSNAGAVFTITSATTPCTVKYDQIGSANYNAAPQLSSVVNSSKAAQSITVGAGKAAPASATFGSSFTVEATAPGGAITYSSAGGCSNVGAVFTMTSGTTACTVKYDQAGSAGYDPAPQVTSQTAATKADQSITITTGKAAPASASFGSSFTVDASAPGGAVSYSSAGGCSNVGSLFTMTSGSNPCSVKFDQSGGANYNAAPQIVAQTAASKAEQSISITSPAPASAALGSSFTVAATASGGAVTYSSAGGCTNSGATFTMTSASTSCTVSYDQQGTADYAAAPQKTSVVTASAGLPGAPTAVTASAAVNGQVSVSFSAPAASGGSAITGYTVTASPGNISASCSGSPIVVTGLSNGTAYTFTVSARNAGGIGTPSAPSTAVTPLPNGDLNGDGVVDLRDAMYALKISIGTESSTAALLNRGDVAPLVNNKPKGDGKLDVGDVIVLLRKSVGLVNW